MTSLNAQQSHILRAFLAVRSPSELSITEQGDRSVYVASDVGCFEITSAGTRFIDHYDNTDFETDRAITAQLMAWDHLGIRPGVVA